MARPGILMNPRLVVVTLMGLVLCLGLCACRSGGLSESSANDPYAANAPRTKEEEDYYKDVYSGEWKKERNLVGDLGIGKTAVATKPPAHWTMDLPHGAKPMSQVYEENYLAMQSARSAGGAVMPPGGAGLPSSGAGLPSSGAGLPGGGAGLPGTYGGYPAGGAMPDTAPQQPNGQFYTPYSPEQQDGGAYPGGGTPVGAPPQEEERPAWMNGWTFVSPKDALPAGTLHSIAMAVRNMAGKSGNFGATEDSAADETITRAQEPDGASADNASAELPADPALADSWRSVNREYLRAESRESENNLGEEYIINGGDDGSQAYPTNRGEMRHLAPNDTVATFETADGTRMLEPSNKIRLYSPRFGSVRQVQGTRAGVQRTVLNQAAVDVALGKQESAVGIDIRSQEEHSNLARGKLAPTGTSANQPGGGVSSAQGTDENVALIKLGDLGNSLMTSDTTVLEGIRAAEGVQYVAGWDKLQEVGVEIERTSAQGLELLQAAESVYVVETDTKSSKLRLLKTASKRQAAPGELVEIAIRYENIGETPITRLAVYDSLAARLQYVDESSKSSRPASFTQKVNEAGSLELKWEINEEISPHQYGVISFMVRVL